MRSTEGGVSVERIWPSNQEVSAKGFGRAIKKSRRKDLAEQSRSLSDKEVGRATKKSRRKDLAEQSRSLGSKEFG
jgi:hypothetical protein